MRVTHSLDAMPFESYSMVHEADSDLIHLSTEASSVNKFSSE
jgi:hypothetical protein